MVLVPIQCPNCAASVDLEEGQTIVRCGYCETTSYLPRPVVVAPFPQEVAQPHPKGARPRSAVGMWVIAPLLALVIGGLALLLTKGGVASDYLTDASAVGGILEDGLGRDVRLLKVSLSGRHTYAEVLVDGDKIVVHRYDGGFARSRHPKGRGDAATRDRSFGLDEVDFAVVGKIVRHAVSRTEDGSPELVTLERAGALRWSVSVNVHGDYETFHYTIKGEPMAAG
jgi:hypothetical protein